MALHMNYMPIILMYPLLFEMGGQFWKQSGVVFDISHHATPFLTHRVLFVCMQILVPQSKNLRIWILNLLNFGFVGNNNRWITIAYV